MNKNILTIIAALAVIASGVYLFINREDANVVEEEMLERSSMKNEEQSEEPLLMEDEMTEEDYISAVVDTFMESFIKDTPAEPDDAALDTAVALFSEGMRDRAPVVDERYHLGMLMKVQDLPDEGYEIESIEFRDNTASGIPNGIAEVTVNLKYSGGDTTRIITLAKINDSWMIDNVGIPQE